MTNMPSHWDYDDLRDPGAKQYMDEELANNGPEAREFARIGNIKLGRDNGRTPVQWTSGLNAGFSDCEEGKTWIGVNGNCRDGINVEDQKTDDNSIWHFWKKQIALRKEHREVFMHGSFEILEKDNEKTFTFLKKATDGLTAVMCLNFSDTEQKMFLPEEVLNGRDAIFLSGNVGQPKFDATPLEAWEGRVYLLKAPIHKSVDERLTKFPTFKQLKVESGDSLKL